MNRKGDTQTDCYGVLDRVFPMGEDGLRHSPETCLACNKKTECLRAAIGRTGGVELEEERVDRAYESGSIRFFERWAKKKSLYHRRRKSKE